MEKRMDEREKDESGRESGGDKEREENAEEVMDQRLKKHISQEHNYAQDLKVEDNGRGSESVVVNMIMVKASPLTVREAVDSEKKRRKQRLEEVIQDWEEEEEDKTEFMETKV